MGSHQSARMGSDVYYQDDLVTLHHGDCLENLALRKLGISDEVLKSLPDNSVDAVITDPPYGIRFMGKAWDGADIEERTQRGREVCPMPAGVGGLQGGYRSRAAEAGRYDLSANAAFGLWCEQWVAECLRVLKPGGYLLAFGGSRTWHRLAVAVEDAGFEIRDSIAWLYGSGFPKSLDVSKAIDKRRDDEAEIRAVCRWLRAQITSHPSETIATIAERFGFHPRMVEHWAARDTDSQPSLPTLEQWDILRELLAFDDEVDAEVFRLNVRKGEPGEAWADRPIVGTVDEWANRTNYALTSRDGLRRGESKNPQAKQWEGWGTSLKPAFEPVVVGRKPLAGTVAANVLEHGTGALNIDGCRVGTAERVNPAGGASSLQRVSRVQHGYRDTVTASEGAESTVTGRWPTNVVLDESMAAELDEQGPQTKSSASPRNNGYQTGVAFGAERPNVTGGHDDAGGPSRFFPVFRYEAKAGAAERPSVDGVAHPTVKPLDLMRWLVRLVTPPGGVVLDPFAGSGTTAEACVHEHMRCITIEREAEYLPLIVSRLSKPMEVGFDFGAMS